MSEHDEQVAVFDIIKVNLPKWPQLKWSHAIANGGHRHPAVAAKLKREGVTAGIADIFVPFPINDHHGLYIELKVKPNKLQDSQADFLMEMADRGYFTAVCWSADEALDTIEKYLHIKLSR